MITKLNMEIHMSGVIATFQVDTPSSMKHSILINGVFHDLSYTGLDFNKCELNRERKWGLDVIHVDDLIPVAIVLNNIGEAAVVDYTQYANLEVLVKDDGSVRLNSFLKSYNPLATQRSIIKGLNTSFNMYSKDSLHEQLELLNIVEQEEYINYCCDNYKQSRNK